MSDERFLAAIQAGYQMQGPSITLGSGMQNGQVIQPAQICAPLSTFNRHGLIAGATGTGKTKTIQLLAEQLSEQGVPVVLMDLKGDLSGLAAPGAPHPKINERQQKLQLPYQAQAYPVELLSLSEQPGVRLRATVSEFGPILFAKMLGLNNTQSSIVSLIFKFCDDMNYPLLDLKDFKKVLNFSVDEGAEIFNEQYGNIAKNSAAAILRSVVELEAQGAEQFFGEPSFDIADLMQTNAAGKGVISVLRLLDLQSKPKLFSSFMLCLLAEIYNTLPEAGDLQKPKLVMFIDEAHLFFDEASDELLNQLESIIKLIRSKAVGIYFCTQNPVDIPEDILSQLGLKVQHALRAFTAKDRKAIKLAAENYPITDFYQTDKVLTELGIGEALVTVLDEKGRPTPLAATYLRAPQSRMGPLNDEEINTLIQQSILIPKYATDIDRNSAYEILQAKLEKSSAAASIPTGGEKSIPAQTSASKQKTNPIQSNWFSSLTKNTLIRQLGRTLVREVARGLLGVLTKRK